LQASLHQATGVEVPAARQRDEPLGVGSQLLRLGLGGHDLVVTEEARRQVGQQRLLVARRARQLASLGAVTHYSGSPSLACACGAAPGSTTFSSSAVSSNFIPKLSPSRRSSSAISPSAFSPTFFTFRRSSSRYCTKSPSVRMLEFLSELTERTESPTSSIERASTSRSRLGAAPPFPAGWAATIGTLPRAVDVARECKRERRVVHDADCALLRAAGRLPRRGLVVFEGQRRCLPAGGERCLPFLQRFNALAHLLDQAAAPLYDLVMFA